MGKITIDDRDRQMLEQLARGVSNREIAESLGYREGTMRVYLHGLYRKLGVANKTSAVIWYFDRLKEDGPPAGTAPAEVGKLAVEESFGDMALRTSPYEALGVMSQFLGAYGRVWEVASRLKGAPADAAITRRRRQSRLLWEALLKGDFAYGKRLHDDDGVVARLLADSPPDCVLLATLLVIGGYTSAADRVVAQLSRARKGRLGVTPGEQTLLKALRDAQQASGTNALSCLYHLAVQKTAKPVFRQLAMVSLYWAYRSAKDPERARDTANALWVEAESARQQLQAMGERPLGREAAVPQPASMNAKALASYLAKVSGARAVLQEH
jgi:DNA-binding CsgD family transcriptional regulator